VVGLTGGEDKKAIRVRQAASQSGQTHCDEEEKCDPRETSSKSTVVNEKVAATRKSVQKQKERKKGSVEEEQHQGEE